MNIPSYQEILIEAVSNDNYVVNFDNIFDTMLSTYPPQMLMQLIQGVDKAPPKLKHELNMFIDYFANCYYMPSIVPFFQRPSIN